MHVNAYLLFNGQCEEAFKFYEKALGGRIDSLAKFADSPMAGHVPAHWGTKVMHGQMMLGDTHIMGSDAPPGHYQAPQGFSVSLGVKEAGEAERIFQELAQDGKVQMPIQKTFWSVRFGMLADRFGIPWIINCEQAAEQAA